jgi:glycosyltransferase involved in cell wall biosynthesis
VAVIIPALNEEAAIGGVVAAIPAWVDDIVVVDNGSTDATAAMARDKGARVIREPQRGYGAACLAGLAALTDPDIIVFLDGDGSDVPSEMALLVDPLIQNQADLVIGSRVLGPGKRGL